MQDVTIVEHCLKPVFVVLKENRYYKNILSGLNKNESGMGSQAAPRRHRIIEKKINWSVYLSYFLLATVTVTQCICTKVTLF